METALKIWRVISIVLFGLIIGLGIAAATIFIYTVGTDLAFEVQDALDLYYSARLLTYLALLMPASVFLNIIAMSRWLSR